MSRWFRFYSEALDDPKVQMLPPELFKAWVNLLCLAGKNDGVLPKRADIAFALRLADADQVIVPLQEAGLLDEEDGVLRPHNWRVRQFKSDVSTDRVKRHRDSKAKQDGNVSHTVPETPPDTEQIQKQKQKEPEQASARDPLAMFSPQEIANLELGMGDLLDIEGELEGLIPWACRESDKPIEQKRIIGRALAKKHRQLSAAPKLLREQMHPPPVSVTPSVASSRMAKRH